MSGPYVWDILLLSSKSDRTLYQIRLNEHTKGKGTAMLIGVNLRLRAVVDAIGAAGRSAASIPDKAVYFPLSLWK